MKSRLIAALAAAAFTTIAGVASPVAAQDKWQPTFRSEQDLVFDEGIKAIDFIRKEYSLQHGFTAQEYGAAVAEQVIRSLRTVYQLGPNFTSADIAANYGAMRVAELLKIYDLPTHFTSDNLRNSKAKQRFNFWSGTRTNLTFPFSAEDYARKRGYEEAAYLATRYRLPTNWVYSDLVSGAGPARASEIRHENGFSKNARHDQIVITIGRKSAAQFAKDQDLPVGFTAEQMANDGGTFQQWDDFRLLPDNFTEADVVAFYGARKIEDLRQNYGLPAHFTEVEMRAAIAAYAISSMQKLYDLDEDFSEADIRQAAGRSRGIEQRNDYKLRPDFTAQEYEAAYNQRMKCYRLDWDYYSSSCN